MLVDAKDAEPGTSLTCTAARRSKTPELRKPLTEQSPRIETFYPTPLRIMGLEESNVPWRTSMQRRAVVFSLVQP